MTHEPGRKCLGYFPTRDIKAGEVKSWPPPVQPAGPWTRCPECAALEDAALDPDPDPEFDGVAAP